ncbi:MAG TPA: hypothetical protein VFH45_07230 [Acidimicrobiales bacterium]|nr:hypothetical protein [Acidimicrobiales bacterium]
MNTTADARGKAGPVSWWMWRGAVVLGGVGVVAGLVVGLFAYAPTAPFAAVEMGLPALMLGALLGALVGTLVQVRSRRVGADGP